MCFRGGARECGEGGRTPRGAGRETLPCPEFVFPDSGRRFSSPRLRIALINADASLSLSLSVTDVLSSPFFFFFSFSPKEANLAAGLERGMNIDGRIVARAIARTSVLSYA